MPGAYHEQVAELLWAKSKGRDTFAILDGARDNRVHASLVNSYLDYSCLYSGNISPTLEAAAPHLVELQNEDRVTRRILREGWGNSWGVMFRSPTTLARLRKHLRGFLLVRDPAGRRLVFRYYDPRVLRVYLPTCDISELKQIYGPIEAFWMEGEDENTLLEFAFDGRELIKKTTTLATPDATDSTA